MRRSEFTVTDKEEFNALANEITVGTLGIMTAGGYPRVVPLNFVFTMEALYFHGADAGEKFEEFLKSPMVTFCIFKEYSLIPSYWVARDYACPATAFFKSALIKGTGSIVPDVIEKAKVLQALMEKYQPEGNYKPITAEESLYKKALEEVAIYKITPGTIDMKFKFGQQYSETKKLSLIEKLEARNIGIDAETAQEIRLRGFKK
ncbi:MAG: pyridoxamine 5'-phosphate oxidase family protein [Ignavibacteriales bacterium]|nr:pyridoxamine 5'-phosphate oxidase family protein [Ignavibacteriales bacterium]